MSTPTQERKARQREYFESLGAIVIREAGEAACLAGYGTNDLEWIGRYALMYGDIDSRGNIA